VDPLAEFSGNVCIVDVVSVHHVLQDCVEQTYRCRENTFKSQKHCSVVEDSASYIVDARRKGRKLWYGPPTSS